MCTAFWHHGRLVTAGFVQNAAYLNLDRISKLSQKTTLSTVILLARVTPSSLLPSDPSPLSPLRGERVGRGERKESEGKKKVNENPIPRVIPPASAVLETGSKW